MPDIDISSMKIAVAVTDAYVDNPENVIRYTSMSLIEMV